jgi:hypothetical protein
MALANTSATIHSLRPTLLKPEAGSETRLVQTSVARVLGLNAALFLQQLNFRLRTPSHVVDGVAWYEASYASLQAVDFPFWCEKTIARTTRRLEKRGIITARPMSRNTYDRTKWYTINDAALQEALGCTTGQNVPLEGTPCPPHEADTLSPSLEEEIREKKEPEDAHVCRGEEEEDRLPAQDQLATDPQDVAADTLTAGNIAAVHSVLAEIGAQDVPELLVVNKVDLAPEEAKQLVARSADGGVAISAETGEGLDDLLAAVGAALRDHLPVAEVVIPYDRGDLLAEVHRTGQVVEEEAGEAGMRVRGRFPSALAGRLQEYAT